MLGGGGGGGGCGGDASGGCGRCWVAVVVLKEVWERFGFVLDDAACPERPWVLHSLLFESLRGQMAEWLHASLLVPQRSWVRIRVDTFVFWQ